MYSRKKKIFFLASNPIGISGNYDRLPAVGSGKSLLWVKLSNSRNALKIMIPSYSWKAISIWTNYSSKVINHNIIEKGMGYRGYKSIVLSNFIAAIVKEQRVNGSYYVSYISYIRSILRDF